MSKERTRENGGIDKPNFLLFTPRVTHTDHRAISLQDRLKNPDEFPRPFINGTWEGFWWAFVTMTTVG